MALDLDNVSVTGTIYCMARVEAGGVARNNGQFNIWSSAAWTNESPTGSILEGSMTFTGPGTNNPVMRRIAKWDQSSRDRFIVNADTSVDDPESDNDIGALFTGTTNRCTVIHENSGGAVQQFDVTQRRSGNAGFVDWWRGDGENQLTLTDWNILNAIADGDEFIFLVHTGVASYSTASEASFSAESGSPTATFAPEHVPPADSEASFSAESGSPTVAISARSVAAGESDASFAAESGSPTVSVDLSTFGLADFNTAGLDTIFVALIESGAEPDGTRTVFYETPPRGTVGSLEAGNTDIATGVDIDKIDIRPDNNNRLVMFATGATNLGTSFQAGGSRDDTTFYFQVAGETRREFEVASLTISGGSSWVNINGLSAADFEWLGDTLTAGTLFIFALARPAGAAEASFLAESGSPDATFTPEADPPGAFASFGAGGGSPTVSIEPEFEVPIVTTSFEAESGSPTVSVNAEFVTPRANARFVAASGQPVVTIAAQFDHTSPSQFNATSGLPVVTIAAEFVTPVEDASFVAESGQPVVTIAATFDHTTPFQFNATSGLPVVAIRPEALRERDPDAEARAHQVEPVRRSTTYRRPPKVTPPLQKRAWDVRSFDVSLGEALNDDDAIASVTSVDAVEPSTNEPTTDVTITDPTSSAGIVTFVAEGGDRGKHYSIRIRVSLTGGVERIEVRAPLEILT